MERFLMVFWLPLLKFSVKLSERRNPFSVNVLYVQNLQNGLMRNDKINNINSTLSRYCNSTMQKLLVI